MDTGFEMCIMWGGGAVKTTPALSPSAHTDSAALLPLPKESEIHISTSDYNDNEDEQDRVTDDLGHK